MHIDFIQILALALFASGLWCVVLVAYGLAVVFRWYMRRVGA